MRHSCFVVERPTIESYLSVDVESSFASQADHSAAADVANYLPDNPTTSPFVKLLLGS